MGRRPGNGAPQIAAVGGADDDARGTRRRPRPCPARSSGAEWRSSPAAPAEGCRISSPSGPVVPRPVMARRQPLARPALHHEMATPSVLVRPRARDGAPRRPRGERVHAERTGFARAPVHAGAGRDADAPPERAVEDFVARRDGVAERGQVIGEAGDGGRALGVRSDVPDRSIRGIDGEPVEYRHQLGAPLRPRRARP